MEKEILDKQKLGIAIQKQRRNLRLTQKVVGEAAGLSRNYFADIEAGRYMPSLNSLYKIAKALRMDFNILLSMSEIQDKRSGVSADQTEARAKI